MLGRYLENVYQKSPIIHCITNYVTANDVANILLAIGAKPVISADPFDVEDITSSTSGLLINIGTLSDRTIRGMQIAARKANELGHPIVFDPVGAGVSAYRTKTAIDLLKDVHFDVIKGNIVEIKTLCEGCALTKDVDTSKVEIVTEDNLDTMTKFAKDYAKAMDGIVVITGKIDLVADADRCYVVRNGERAMAKVMGTGCQLGALIASYVSSQPENRLDAVAAGVCEMGLAGEIGWSLMEEYEGNSTFRNRIIDAVFHMTASMLDECEKFEIR